MWKKWYLALLLAFILLLCACTAQQDGAAFQVPSSTPETEMPEVSESASPEAELPDDTAPEPAPTETHGPQPPEEEDPEPTQENIAPPQPEHSEWYVPDCTAQQMTEYFEEVVLNMEYSDGSGEEHLVQKWLSPIRYRLYGTPTETDLEVLDSLVEQLNTIPGFPGICAAEDGGPENMYINFLDWEEFDESFSEVINGEYAFGAVQFWYYTATNELHTANIGCRTDIDQSARNSVLVEEVINALGLSDTVLRTDSITYQYSNDNTALSEIDLAILKLLYDPAIECGMDAERCAQVIQDLYY